MESEEGAEKKPCNQQVTPVGNAWILSRSKSYSGRVYYFNTMTGEALWNLSNEEIEKAKKRTEKISLQSGNFPEPQGPPMDHINHINTHTADKTQLPVINPQQVYHKQIINNQFTRSPYETFVPPCYNCSPINTVESMGGRPNVWVQPPPIFMASAGMNQKIDNVTPTKFHQNFTVQNTSVSLSSRFTCANMRGKRFMNCPHGVGKFTPRKNKFYNRNSPFVPKRTQNQYVSDLRAVLSAKKTANETSSEPEEHNVQTDPEPTVIVNKRQEPPILVPPETEAAKIDINPDTDDEWLKKHCTVDGIKLKLDVTSLKNFATKNSNCESWYIVVDKNVLMNHFNFLNVLSTSDEQCKLMIIRDVMTELQAAARSDITKLEARKIVRGLSQLFASKLAVIAEYSFTQNELKDTAAGMINFCSMLQQQNEHVLLVSNEEGLQKNMSKVLTFTVQAVKELLVYGTYKVNASPVIERNIKITIPNDIVYYKDDASGDDGMVTKSTSTDMLVQDVSKTSNTAPITKEMNIQTDNVVNVVTASIKMVDAEVQTDPSFEFTQPTRKDSIGVNTVDTHVVSYLDNDTNVGSNTMVNENPKTKEIRLKRSISNRTISNHTEIDKKHFKWHRKRKDGSVAFSDSASSLDDRVSAVSMPSITNSIPLANIQNTICEPRPQSSNIFDDNFVDGSETSSCIFMRKDASENILVEETSTSDVISNSLDSECMQEVNKSKNEPSFSQSKNVMFEITSNAMEHNLKMRRDEWLAEFNQIMEEVLTQVLQLKSEYKAKTLPPPWTLHEATECIKRIFDGDSDVIDAANKLSQVIHKMSDVKGKMIADFQPNAFMELYSYGVYLVDSLQAIWEKCEDLQIAAESLAKLLRDIENPIGHSEHNDSFGDSTEVSVVISQSSTEVAANQDSQSVVSNKSTTSRRTRNNADAQSNKSPGNYNLRSKNKNKPNEDNVETATVNFIRKVNINDDFFKKLHLRKGVTANNNTQIVEDPGKLAHDSVKDKNADVDESKASGPNIIRNFTRFPDFEAKLQKQTREPLDMDMLDYSIGNNDYMDNEYDHMEQASSDDDEDGEYNEVGMSIEKSEADVNNNDFKNLVTSLMEAIRETTVKVHLLCQNTHNEIMTKDMDSDRRNEIHDKAQKAHAHIQNICNSFRRIKERNMEDGGPFRSRLKEAGILLKDHEVLMYRDVIDTCIKQGDTLLESLNVIIDSMQI